MDDISEKTIRAAAGLYGIVHVRHLCEIVEHYTGKRYSRAQLNQMMDEQDWHPLRREQGFIYRPDAFAASRSACSTALESAISAGSQPESSPVIWRPSANASFISAHTPPGMSLCGKPRHH